MAVTEGEVLRELGSGKMLVVEHSFDSKKDTSPSKYFDFLAEYTHSSGVSTTGEKIKGNRGLRLVDEGKEWERV